MATLILGGVGAAIGSATGGPAGARWGWAIGTVIGSWIDRPQVPDSEIGKLSDLKLSGSSYNSPFARVKGKAKVGGNLVWVKVDGDGNHLVEHSHRSGGGKGGGGGSQTSYTYSSTFAVAFCEGVVFNRDYADALGGSFTDRGVRIKKIYADDELIWEYGSSSNVVEPEVFDGTEDQSPSSTIASTVSGGSSKTCAFRGLAYAVFVDMDLSNYGNRIPNMTAVTETDSVTVGDVYEDFAREAGVLATQLNVASATDLVTGFVETSRKAPSDTLESLCTALNFEQTEVDGKLKPVRRGSVSPATIDEAHLGASSGSQRVVFSRVVKQVSELPGSLTVSFLNLDKDLQQWSETETRQSADVANNRSVDLPMAFTTSQGKQICARELDRSWLECHSFTLSLPLEYLTLAPGDSLWLPTPVGPAGARVTKMVLAPIGEIVIDAVREKTAVFTQDQSGSSGGSGAVVNPAAVIPSVFTAWSGKELTDAETNKPGFYVAATGDAGWRGGAVWYSLDGGSSYTRGPFMSRRCIFGETASVLSASGAVADTYDDTNTVDVDLTVSAGSLESATDAQVESGVNQAVVGDEILGFGNVSLTSAYHYTLSHLRRGERRSTMSGHASAERFVVASTDLARVSVDESYIGSTVKVKVVSPGQTLADVTAVDVVIVGNTPVFAPADTAKSSLVMELPLGTLSSPGPVTDLVMRMPRKKGAVVTWQLDRIVARTETAASTDTDVDVEKSASGGSFSPSVVAGITLPGGDEEAETTTSLPSFDSDDLLRVDVTTLGTGLGDTTLTFEFTQT